MNSGQEGMLHITKQPVIAPMVIELLESLKMRDIRKIQPLLGVMRRLQVQVNLLDRVAVCSQTHILARLILKITANMIAQIILPDKVLARVIQARSAPIRALQAHVLQVRQIQEVVSHDNIANLKM